jgi:hypothetical protein
VLSDATVSGSETIPASAVLVKAARPIEVTPWIIVTLESARQFWNA